jgi:hypothetical protein
VWKPGKGLVQTLWTRRGHAFTQSPFGATTELNPLFPLLLPLRRFSRASPSCTCSPTRPPSTTRGRSSPPSSRGPSQRCVATPSPPPSPHAPAHCLTISLATIPALQSQPTVFARSITEARVSPATSYPLSVPCPLPLLSLRPPLCPLKSCSNSSRGPFLSLLSPSPRRASQLAFATATPSQNTHSLC